MIIHVVKKGETLWSISNQYMIGINSIIDVNQLENPSQLVVGQAIIIPTPDNVHIVRPGETLWTISQTYKTTVTALVQENQISNPNLVSVGQVLRIPKPTIEVNGYLTSVGVSGENTARKLGLSLTYLSMFSYTVNTNGSVNSLNDVSVIGVARNLGVAPLLSLTNIGDSGFSSTLAHTILANPELQDALLSNLITIMKQKKFVGLNIDFEYVFPADKELYNQFLAKSVKILHPQGFSVSTALAPKIRADQKGLLYEAHDYQFHGRTADFVILMTYEWGWVGGPPMAVAPINEVKRVLDYAVTEIPRSKIMMGVPLYAYDWKLPFVWGTTRAETLNQQAVLRRAIKFGVTILYDTVAQSPHFNYVDSLGNTHTVWFEDARSYQAKYDVVKSYRLRGVSYWSLNTQTPQNWPVLLSNFKVRKLI